MKHLIVIFLFFTGLSANAQETFSITGTVKDEKGITIPGATVFLSGSKKITATNVNGEFSFSSLTSGAYEVVVKMLGFTPRNQNITIQQKSVELIIIIKENKITLNEVVIKGRPDPDRPRYLKLFREYFIGSGANAAGCKILNPEVLHFRYNKPGEILQASTDEFLSIENPSLGYRINFLVNSFTLDLKNKTFEYTGSPYFEELTGSAAQQAQWEQNRQTAYEGSIRHFFKAAFNNKAEAEGFLVYQLPDQQVLNKLNKSELSLITPINSGSLFSVQGPDSKLLKLKPKTNFQPGSGGLYIIYTKEREPFNFSSSELRLDFPLKAVSRQQKQFSLVNARSNVISIDRSGILTPANSFEYFGYWTWEKVGDLVPLDYSTEAADPAEVANLEKMIAAIDTFHTTAPVEKVHIHFDKPYYAIGDTIWMKAYVVNAGNQLSDLSKILYVDLIDGKDSIKSTLRLPLISGLTMGDFALNEKLAEGNYRIRAYTNRMRNFSDEFFFDKTVPIGNSTPKAAAISTGVQSAILNPDLVDMQFFPEGGRMVDNIRSKIAFKALSPGGLSVAVSGYIADKENNKVAEFKSEHAGMGSFFLTPNLGNTYTAVLQFGSLEKRFPLPTVEPGGYVLSVAKTDSASLFIEVSASKDLMRAGAVTLLAQSNGLVQTTTRIPMRQPVMKLTLNKSDFPDGILQLTLFSPSYQPVAERLVFIRQSKSRLEMTISTNKPAYTTREKVNMTVEANDFAGKAIIGSFSVAVTDMTNVPVDETDETTILSNLLLSSDLKGDIEKPNYYFTGPSNTDKEIQLDNLMLTQGWRRFAWQDILSGAFPSLAYKAEKGIHLSGKLVNAGGRPVANGKISILFNTLNIRDTTSNELGEFSFTDFDISQGTSFHVMAEDSKGNTDVNLILDKMVPPAVRMKHSQQDTVTGFRAYLESIRQRAGEMQKYEMLKQIIALEEVTIAAESRNETIKKIAVQSSTNLLGPGNADQVITFAELERKHCIYLYQCLQGIISGVQIVKDSVGNGSRAYSRGTRSVANGPQPMKIYLDGANTGTDLEIGVPSEISSIEILKGTKASIYGMNGGDGVILITTKKGGVDYSALADEYNGRSSASKEKIKRDKPQEYYFGREFYSPVYSTPKTNTQLADLRTTIYWNPDLVTDSDGKVSFDYFTADGPGTYRVVIEGLDDSGRLGRKVFTYTVK